MALTKVTQEGFIGTIMLDHAEKRNTLSSELINEIIAALDAFRADKLRAAVIRAQPGARVFSAGYNILELPVTHRQRVAGSQTGANIDVIVRAFRELVQFRMQLWREGKPSG